MELEAKEMKDWIRVGEMYMARRRRRERAAVRRRFGQNERKSDVATGWWFRWRLFSGQ